MNYHIITREKAEINRFSQKKGGAFMYENNYNYIDVPEENNKPKGNAGKTMALILSVALVGGASGFGGAYLQNTLMEDKAAVAITESSDSQQVNAAAGAVTTAPTSSQNESNKISSLLNASSQSGALTTKQIVEKVSPSVVGVHAGFSEQNSTGTGTGIILSDEGYIITNAHVVQSEVQEYIPGIGGGNYRNGFGGFGGYDDIFDYFFGNKGGSYQTTTKNADKVSIVLSGDDETEYEAEIIGADPNSDIAVLKIDASAIELQAAEFGNSDELTMGDKAVAIGYPLGLGLSTSEGIVSGLNRTLNVELSAGGTAAMTLIQTDAAINPGNSGGPLINERGQVVGITSSKLVNSSVEGLGFAIPITDAMPIISDLMNQGYVTNRTPQIGITGSDVNSAMTRYYGLPVDKGVMVVSVDEGSGAAEAGISAGDVIVAVDGKEIESMEELAAAKNNKEIGDKITLTLARANGDVDIEVTLTGEQPPETETAEG